MANIDRKTIEEIGIPSLVLMENAARALLRVVLEEFPEAEKILVVAGKGNNGGDGLALARMLHLIGKKVDFVLPLGDPKGDADYQLSVLRKLGLKPLEGEADFGSYDLVVDAIFGTGFSPPVKGKAGQVIEKINREAKRVLAVDVPSGLSADSGRVYEPSVKADVTVTFQFPKVCHLLFPSSKLCGKVMVADISIPNYLAQEIKRELIDPKTLKLPRRERDTYKTKEGHVLIVGGSPGKTGAVIMACRSATKTGSGLVTAGVPSELNPIFETSLLEEMSLPLPEGDRLSVFSVKEIVSMQERISALALGMGMGRYEEGQDIVREIILNWGKPLLLDADALNNLADLGNLEILKKRRAPAVLTPHVGEFSRLAGLEPKEINENLIDVAQDFSTRYGCFLVLKSARTVVSTPDGRAFLSVRGTPAMAKGGSGDVLSGILVSLMGRTADILSALLVGVTLHGVAGELAERKLHRESVRAGDLIELIPEAYKVLESLSEEGPTPDLLKEVVG